MDEAKGVGSGADRARHLPPSLRGVGQRPRRFEGSGRTMRLMRFTTGVALSALIATSAAGQTAPQTPPTQERPQTPPAGQAAGRVDPA